MSPFPPPPSRACCRPQPLPAAPRPGPRFPLGSLRPLPPRAVPPLLLLRSLGFGIGSPGLGPRVPEHSPQGPGRAPRPLLSTARAVCPLGGGNPRCSREFSAPPGASEVPRPELSPSTAGGRGCRQHKAGLAEQSACSWLQGSLLAGLEESELCQGVHKEVCHCTATFWFCSSLLSP